MKIGSWGSLLLGGNNRQGWRASQDDVQHRGEEEQGAVMKKRIWGETNEGGRSGGERGLEQAEMRDSEQESRKGENMD